jgi:hypothetical protein
MRFAGERGAVRWAAIAAYLDAAHTQAELQSVTYLGCIVDTYKKLRAGAMEGARWLAYVHVAKERGMPYCMNMMCSASRHLIAYVPFC